MKILKMTSLILVLMGFVWSGCTRDLYNVNNAPVPSTKGSLGLEDVKKAIMKSRGTNYVHYQMNDFEPGLIRCVLTYKNHRAIVDITYSVESYSLLYKSSRNLSYQPASVDNAATIHRHYNTWIRDLDESIKLNLSILRARRR